MLYIRQQLQPAWSDLLLSAGPIISYMCFIWMIFTNLPVKLSSAQFLLNPGLEVSSFGSACSEEVHHPTMSCSVECVPTMRCQKAYHAGVQEGQECASPI